MKNVKFVPMRIHSNWTYVYATTLTGQTTQNGKTYWIVPRYLKKWKSYDTCIAHCDTLNSKLNSGEQNERG
jgi:hypothetical protein